MYLATVKQLHDFIWTELTIIDQVISRVNYLANKDRHLEITKVYPIFEWIPDIPITYKGDETKGKEYEIDSTHEYKHDDIT